MKAWLTAVAVGLAWTASGCAKESGTDDDGASQAASSAKTEYVSIVDFDGAAYQGAWYDIGSKLNGELASLCGDTFCEGDFAPSPSSAR